MNKWWSSVAVALVAACGSVSSKDKPDASVPGDAATGASLTLANASRWVPQSSSAQVPFTVARTTSMGDLTVHVTGLPAGVTAADVTVAAGATSGMLTFAATSAASLGVPTDVMVTLADGAKTVDTKQFTVKVSGAPGTLDTTFGTAGRAVISLPDPVVAQTTGTAQPRAMLVYPASAGTNAGKVLIGSTLETTGATSTTKRFAVMRLNVDGSLDTSFGAGLGYTLVNPGATKGMFVAGLAFDSQGRIVLTTSRVDTSDVCHVFAVRLTPTGALDSAFTTFDQGEPGGYCGNPESVAVLPGDKIESINYWNNPNGSQLPELMMINSDGTPDNTAFPGNTFAKRVAAVNSKTMFDPYTTALDANGKLVMAGTQCAGGWNTAYSACESVVARMATDGTWDTTFGTTGYTSLTFGNTTSGTIQRFIDFAFDSAQNIIAVGYNDGATTATMMKLTPAGALDMSFGTSGRLTPQLITGGTQFEFDDVVVDEEDRLVVTGYSNSGGSLLVTARYSKNGVLDTTYGTNGFTTTPTAAIVWSSGLEPDGRLVIVGSYPRTGGGYEVAAWRFWP
jgi:uncharacterized delta-60 repeat protein